jgi:hypothetical protein
MMTPPSDAVVALGDLGVGHVRGLLDRYGVELVEVAAGAAIPFSYWGEPEAGICGMRLYARPDTPAHSVLHELCHLICMPQTRRDSLARDAGGDDAEECAVCCLQILLAGALAGFGCERALVDMDRWGYSFREGSAARWFYGDGADARAWLFAHRLIDAQANPTWIMRA